MIQLIKPNFCFFRQPLFFAHVLKRASTTVLDTGFQSLSAKLGFWIPIVSGIPDSLSCIPDSKVQDFRFRISKAEISRIPESGFAYLGSKFQPSVRLNQPLHM